MILIGLIVILVAVIALVLLVVLGFSLKLFRIERVPNSASPNTTESAEPSPDEEDAEDQPEELVNLVEYFNDGVSSEVKETANEQKAVEEEKTYDKLTDLMIGRAYVNECKKLLEAAKESGESCAVIYFDVDRFRFINSIKGYSLGDYVLEHLAHDLCSVFPEGSLFTRISADHFAVAFRATGGLTYEEYAEEIRKVCEKIRDDIGVKGTIHVTMGIADTNAAIGEADAYDMNILLLKANLARHCLKSAKTETFSVYDDSVITSYLYGESATDDFNENQYSDDISVCYQAISDPAKNQITGCEALSRWVCQEATGEAVTPDNGKIPTNGNKVFYQVCRAASRWRKAGKALPQIFVNISDPSFFKADFDEFILHCMSEFQLETGNFCVVVDAAFVRLDWTVANRQIKRLRDAGMMVGIGGIDASYKSLDFIAGLPVNFVKFHKSFFHDITKRPEAETAIRDMQSQAEAQNLKTIFEGINVKEQADIAKKLGVSQCEGRYAGKPVSADDFIRLLREQSTPKKPGDGTVILTEKELNQGDYKI